MEKIEKTLKFLSTSLNIIRVIMIVPCVILIFTCLFNIFYPIEMFSTVDVPANIVLESSVNGRMLNESFSLENIEFMNSFIKVPANTVWARVYHSLIKIGFIFLAFFMIVNLTEIVDSLKNSINNRSPFMEVNYIRIREIAYMWMAIGAVLTLESLIYYFFIIDEYNVTGLNTEFSFNIEFIGVFITAAFLFIIAEVYKAGIKLREENELTI